MPTFLDVPPTGWCLLANGDAEHAGTVLLAVHTASTLAMTGLIWFVQIVHYPLMRRVGVDGFTQYERQHARRTSVVVGPLMLAEMVTAVILTITPPTDGQTLTRIGLGLLAMIWFSTAVLQVPCHRRLERGYDSEVIRRLVATNWLRTVAWTARAVIALLLLDP